MNTTQIAKWLYKNKSNFYAISIACGVSVPTLYSLVVDADKKRQQRVIDAVSNYIAAQPKGKK